MPPSYGFVNLLQRAAAGQTEEDGREVVIGPASVAVQLSDGDGNLAEIVRALDAAGVVLSQLQIHEPTLDDVFLAKTGRHLEGSGDGDADAAEREPEPARA